jgi:hypothetical protein
MKLNPIAHYARRILTGLTLLCAVGVANAALTLKYTFNDVVGTTVPNTAAGATINGTLTAGTSSGGLAPAIQAGPSVNVGGTLYPLGSVCNFNIAGYNDGWTRNQAPFVNTNQAQSLWGISGNTPYTVMAWVKFESQAGDNMLFGPYDDVNALHLGSRDTRHWSGHWGDDVEGTNIATDTANWHHITWTNDASNNQQIYRDGVLMTGTAGGGISGGGAGSMDSSRNLAVGTSNNGGSFRGQCDEVKIWNEVLTPAQIQAEMVPTLINPVIIISALTGNTAGSVFVASLVLQDGSSPGRQVVPAAITSVTFNGVAAASFSASKTDNLTTVTATLAGAYTPGAFVYNVRVQGTDAGAAAYDLNRNLNGPILPPVADIAAAAPFSSTPSLPWAVREYSTTAANGTAAMGTILTNTPPYVDVESPVINYNDPQNIGDRGDFNNDIPFPGDTAADDNHVLLAKAKVTVPAAGTWSFNFRTDDGCGLKIQGANCTGAFGVGRDPSDSSFVFNDGVTSGRAAFTFPAAGTYDVAFITFDGGGPGSAELSWAEGAVTANDERQLPWALFGNAAHPSLPATTSAFPTNLPGLLGTDGNWGIRTYRTLNFENVDNLAMTMAFLSNPDVACWTPGNPLVTVSRTSWKNAGQGVIAIDSLTTPDFPVPVTAGSAQLTLVHRHSFEADLWDGGIVEYSVNGGAFTYLTPASFTQNGYTGAIIGSSLTGTVAFGEDSVGYGSGDLITSVATIPGINPGDELQIRLTAAYDECCLATNPSWEIARVRVNWGAATAFDSNLTPTSDGGLIGSGLWVFDPGGVVTTRTEVVDTQSPTLVFRDPDTNGEGGVVVNSQPFPGNAPGDDDRVVTVAKCRINVTTAGDYTFNDHSDDGFLLRIKAVSGPDPVFRTVTGGGGRTMSAPNEMYFLTGTGDADTRGVIYLNAGQYDLTFVNWEGGGGFFYQLTMAAGVRLNNADTNDWVPVGHQATNEALKQPTMESQWQVKATLPGAFAGGDLATALAAVDAAATPTNPFDVVNFTDPQTNGAGPGSFGSDLNWPHDTGADDNNFAIKSSGYLHIEQAGYYVLGYRGDDGSNLVLQGVPAPGFTGFLQNNIGSVIGSVAPGTNNAIIGDVDTGDSWTLAVIYLNADDYPIDSLFYEEGGGAFFELMGSALSQAQISPAKARNLVLLRSDPSYPGGIPTFVADNVSSFPLVSRPTANLSGGFTSYSFGQGDNYSFTFPTTPGLPYALEYSTDLVNWTVISCVYAGAGDSTTINGLISSLDPPLPAGTSRLQFRARSAH